MHEEISPIGRTFSIRISRPRFAVSSLDEMTIDNGEEVAKLLEVLISSRNNIVICGRTGTGKTEVQKMLVKYMEGKISLIEDTQDSHIKALYPEKDINSWKTVPGIFSMADGIVDGLRNDPDWLIPAEVRDFAAAAMLDGAKTGHGVAVTLHTKGAMHGPSRLIPMIRQSSAYAIMDDQLIGREIVEFLPFYVHLIDDKIDGITRRRIAEIVEFTDFTKSGAVGRYIYRESVKYNEETKEYEPEITLGALSDKTLQVLKNKKLYHLLPEVFKGTREVAA